MSHKQVRRSRTMKPHSWLGAAFLAAVLIGPASQAVAAPAPAPVTSTMPDWSGMWEGAGSLFELGKGFTNLNDLRQKARDFPPYTPEWEAGYEKFLKEVYWPGKAVDPINLCLPTGFPRIMASPRGTAFIVRPEMTTILKEQGWFRIIYTDGRKFPADEDMWPTWEGWSIGHWEGDTLVVETKGLRNKIVIDRTGLLLSDKMSSVERIRRVDADTMEDVMTFTDPVALTRPWTVRRTWSKQPADSWIASNHCGEAGDRNPIVNGENTVVLGSELKGPPGNYPASIAKFAAW
jgi:hypothetical protein